MGLFNSLNSKKDRREEPPVKIVQVYEFGGGALPSCTNPTCTPPFFYLTAKIRQSWSTCIISIRSRPAADPPTWWNAHTDRCITMMHTTQCPWQCQKKKKSSPLGSAQWGRVVYILPFLSSNSFWHLFPPLSFVLMESCVLLVPKPKDKLIDRAGSGYRSRWSSAVTPNLLIDSIGLQTQSIGWRWWVGGWEKVGLGCVCVCVTQVSSVCKRKHSSIKLVPLLHHRTPYNPNLHNRLLHCLAQTH